MDGAVGQLSGLGSRRGSTQGCVLADTRADATHDLIMRTFQKHSRSMPFASKTGTLALLLESNVSGTRCPWSALMRASRPLCCSWMPSCAIQCDPGMAPPWEPLGLDSSLRSMWPPSFL